MKLTLLGTANAASIPVYGCECVACQRAMVDPFYRRLNCSALLEFDDQKILIDAGLPDITARFAPGELTKVLITHYHPDHVQGLLHLRWGAGFNIQVLSPKDPVGFADLYRHPGILDFSSRLSAFEPYQMDNLEITPLPLLHSKQTLGYAFRHNGKHFAYLTDTAGLPLDTVHYLAQNRLDVMVIDCAFPPGLAGPLNHNDIDMAILLHQAIKPKKSVLSHISHELDCWLLDNEEYLPSGIVIGHDGQVLR